MDTGDHEVLDLSTGSLNKSKVSPVPSNKETVHSALYIKDRVTISNEAYHELSMVSDLPRSHHVQALAHGMNSEFIIIHIQRKIFFRATIFLNSPCPNQEGIKDALS